MTAGAVGMAVRMIMGAMIMVMVVIVVTMA